MRTGDFRAAVEAFQKADSIQLPEAPNYMVLPKLARAECLSGQLEKGSIHLDEFDCMVAVDAGELPCYLEAAPGHLGHPNPRLRKECFERMCGEILLPAYADQGSAKRRMIKQSRKEAEKARQLCSKTNH